VCSKLGNVSKEVRAQPTKTCIFINTLGYCRCNLGCVRLHALLHALGCVRLHARPSAVAFSVFCACTLGCVRLHALFANAWLRATIHWTERSCELGCVRLHARLRAIERSGGVWPHSRLPALACLVTCSNKLGCLRLYADLCAVSRAAVRGCKLCSPLLHGRSRAVARLFAGCSRL
jgi:hypothetical protein